jgi:DNA polymerase-3 subunit gamma/tau
MVSVVDQPGEPTLAEVKRKAEEDHQARARSHPLMQAVMTAFPEAKILSLKQKTVALAALAREDETSETEESIPETENEE